MRQSVFRTLGLRLVFRFCPKRRSFRMEKSQKKKKKKKKKNPNQSLTRSTMPVLGFPVGLFGFRISPIFKLFSVFTHNRTRLMASSQLNRSDQLVWSGF